MNLYTRCFKWVVSLFTLKCSHVAGVSVYICTCECTVHMHACVCVCVCWYTYTHTYIHWYMCMCVPTYVHNMHMCMCRMDMLGVLPATPEAGSPGRADRRLYAATTVAISGSEKRAEGRLESWLRVMSTSLNLCEKNKSRNKFIQTNN